MTALRSSRPVRVVLAGRTGLEAVLRRDPTFDLCRASSAMDAIGEAGEDGARAVLVGELLDRGLGAERSQFIGGLKQAAPGTRVLLVSAATDGIGADGYDGRLTGGESSGEVMQAISRGGTPPAAAELAEPAAPAASSAPAPSRPSGGGADPAGEQAGEQEGEQPAGKMAGHGAGLPDDGGVGDQALIAHITRGHDIVPAAIDLIRARLDDPSARFEPGLEPGFEPGAGDDGCPVVTSLDVPLGRLVSRRSAEEVAPHARWLAGWLVLARQMAQLRQQAFTDHLTGAWNRRFFDRYMAGAVERARRDRRDLTLLVFDIDDFKPFNDRFGHAAGDLILTDTVRLLRSVIRPTDKVARIGGDEFVVIFDDPAGPRDPGSRHPVSVRQIAERFQSQIRGHRFPSLGIDAPGSLSVSGGIATFPWDGQTPGELLRRADERALESKRVGKNIITIGADRGS